MALSELSSPADRYQAARATTADARGNLGAFKASLPFDLDDFQLTACRALEAGRGVLLAAPTGAGKTIVGEFAVYLALARGHKAFYTTPIKALSNQKYQELAATYGADRVGLLTGDTSINAQAPIVVMTTEVLRNMLYADSASLTDLAYVVMDEVHYLADRFRGAVWEEVIIHLPSEVAVVSLSATVSNAEEFGAWLGTVRGDTAVIVSEHRPVPLFQHVLVHREIVDLFATHRPFEAPAADRTTAAPAADRTTAPAEAPAADSKDATAGPPARRDRFKVNPDLIKLARSETPDPRRGRHGSRPGRRDPRGRYDADTSRHSPLASRGDHGQVRKASRPQVIRALEAANLLPAITFIFSRAACDAAVEQCAAAGIWLTSRAEQDEIAQRVDAACASLPDADRDVLGFWGWRDGLLRGLAAHHAGMLPSFKEIVEELFVDGLVRAVFATETLALGINMPARTVVLEKLEKFNGEAHVPITAGEYTQLTGRAGRRGIDVEGHAVVIWQPGTDPAAVAGLASKRTYPLTSSFRPSYNMSINLMAQFGRRRTRDILESSFAQFQADRSVVDLARGVRSREASLAGYTTAMTCHLGDFADYARLRRELSDQESGASKSQAKQRRAAVGASLAALRPGDVILVPGGRTPGHAVVVDADPQARHPRPGILTVTKELRRLSSEDLPVPAVPVTRVRLGKGFNAKVPKDRKNLLAAVAEALATADSRPGRSAFTPPPAPANGGVAALREALAAHPCHACPDREAHARWSERWWKLRKETDEVAAAIAQRTNTIAATFDRVTDLLAAYAFVAPDPAGNLRPTMDGQRLRRVYGEKDLLIALALREDALADLDAAELAAAVTSVVFQAKRDGGDPRPPLPSVSLEAAIETILQQWAALIVVEQRHRLPVTGEPDLGLVWPMFKWAKGQPLQECLRGTDLAAGDFVRWTKQVIDLLGQLGSVPGLPADFPRVCAAAVALLRRGVVAYTSTID